MIALKIFCLLFSLWTIISLIWGLVESSKASNYTYFLCRPLRLFGTTLFTGVILWTVFIIAAIFACKFGLTLFC